MVMTGSLLPGNLHITSAGFATRLVRETMDHEAVPSRLRMLVGPVAVLWDIENCPVPSDVNAEDVAGNIRMALRVHPAVKGVVTMFSAYGDFNRFPRRLREGCQRTGVNLIDVPNGRKDAADKAILVDMFLFALDNPPPCTILLISGDVDFAPALHKLGQRGYMVVLAVPAGGSVSSALRNAGRFVWDWPSVARGEGLIAAKAFPACFVSNSVEDKFTEVADYAMAGTSCFPSDDSDRPYEDEHYAYWCSSCNEGIAVTYNQECPLSAELARQPIPLRTLSGNVFVRDLNSISVNQESAQPFIASNSQRFYYGQVALLQKQQLPGTYVTTSTFLGEPSVSEFSTQSAEQCEAMNSLSMGCASAVSWVQPSDVQGLKLQLVKLLEMNGGKLMLACIPSVYYKLFGRPLYLAEYGSSKLVQLLEKMPDAFYIKGEGNRKTLHLKEHMADVVHASNMSRRARYRGSRKERKSAGNDYRMGFNTNLGSYRPVAFHRGMKVSGLMSGKTDSQRINILPSDDDKASDQLSDKYGDANEQNMMQNGFTTEEHTDAQEYAATVRLEVFRQELQELLVSHACKMLFTSFLTFYQQKYSYELDLRSFGVKELKPLLEKVKDVAILKEEEGTGRQYLVAASSYQVSHSTQ